MKKPSWYRDPGTYTLCLGAVLFEGSIFSRACRYIGDVTRIPSFSVVTTIELQREEQCVSFREGRGNFICSARPKERCFEVGCVLLPDGVSMIPPLLFLTVAITYYANNKNDILVH